MSSRPSTNKYLATAAAYASFFEALINGEASKTSLMENSGLSASTAAKLLRIMHRRRLIYVCRWEADVRGAKTIRIFKIGNKPDVPKPPPRTSNDRKRDRRRRRTVATKLKGAGWTPESLGKLSAGPASK